MHRTLGTVFVAYAAALLPANATADLDDPSMQQLPGPPPWLGVTMEKGTDIGVPIVKVVRGSPADKAGVKTGDRIVSVDGTKVTQPSEVSRLVQSHRIGEIAAVGIERGGSAQTQSVKLAVRPSGDQIIRMDLVGGQAPAFSNVTPIGAAPASVAALKGKVVVLDFWATWCGPCRLVAPKLSALKDRFGAQGLTVVGVTTDDVQLAATFMEQHGMKYPSVADGKGDTSKAYGVTSLPTMLVIDKKGVVREVFVGYESSSWTAAIGDTKVEALVKSLLAEK